MQIDKFVLGFMAKLDGKLNSEDFRMVKNELEVYSHNFSIEKAETSLALLNQTPESVKAFLVTKKIEGRSDGTISLYKSTLNFFFQFVPKPLEKITSNDIRFFLYEFKRVRKVGDRTMDNRRLILSSYFNWCFKEGYISHDPTKSVGSIKYEIIPRRPFTDIELELIRDACKTPKEKAIIEVLYSTGCRVSELINIKLQDLNYENREVQLFGKGRKHRTSYLNAKACVAIDNYMKVRKGDSDYLFVTDRAPHHGMTRNSIEHVVHEVGNKAGIKGVCPHRMRHTMATDALERGMPVTDVKEVLGHEKLDTTMIYVETCLQNVAYNHAKCVI